MLCQQSNRSPTCTSVYDRYIIACRLNATLSSVSPRGNGNVKPLFPFITFYERVNHEHFFFTLWSSIIAKTSSTKQFESCPQQIKSRVPLSIHAKFSISSSVHLSLFKQCIKYLTF